MEEFNTSQNEIPLKPDNSMTLSIIGTIIGLCGPCCIGFIVGVIAIIFSSQVNNKFKMEDYAGAQSTAKNAKMLGYTAIIIGIIGIIVAIIIIMMIKNTPEIMEHYQEALKQYQ